MKGDSAATSHYIRPIDKDCLSNIHPYTGPLVVLPDADSIPPSHQGTLTLHPNLSKDASTGTILPQLKSASLLSLGQLCDGNCDILLQKKKLYVLKNKKIVLQGHRNPTDKLWDIPIQKSQLHASNYVEPTTHAGLYLSKNKPSNSVPLLSKAKAKKYKKSTYNHSLQSSNDIIDSNDFDNAIHKQLQLDAKNYKLAQVLPKVNIVLRKRQPHLDLVSFLHGACFAPVVSTWIKAINNGHFTTWPGLTSDLVRKYLPPSIHTEKGHLNQERKFLQSTKPKSSNYDQLLKEIKYKFDQLKTQVSENTSLTDVVIKDILKDAFPSSDVPNVKKHEAIYAIIKDSDITAYTDQTGRFPYRSSRGNEYLMIGYHYDANAILVGALKNREAQTLTTCWNKLNARFNIAGVQPTTYVMDNECSYTLKDALTKQNIKWQLVPPKTHRRNAAERAIQTYKNHLKAGLSMLDPNFPVREWDRILPQSELTLNLLRASRTNPRLSAWAYLFGQYDFNTNPIAPPGTKVVVHSKPEERGSWAPNGEEGWSIGPSFHHYRCIKCYFPKTRSERDCDTITFIPHVIPFPKITTSDFLRQAATDIISILTNPPSSPIPTLEAGDTTYNALLKLATILKRKETIPNLPSLSPSLHTKQKTSDTSTLSFDKTNNIKYTSEPRVSKDTTRKPRVRKTPVPTWRRGEITFPQTRYRLRSSTSDSFRSRAAKHLLAQHVFSNYSVNHIYDDKGRRLRVDDLLNGENGRLRMNA